MTDQSPPKGISAYGIARETGHSAVAIYHRIRKLNIQPVIVSEAGQFLYDPSIVETLRGIMRKPRLEGNK
jgi:hypothetical protein